MVVAQGPEPPIYPPGAGGTSIDFFLVYSGGTAERLKCNAIDMPTRESLFHPILGFSFSHESGMKAF